MYNKTKKVVVANLNTLKQLEAYFKGQGLRTTSELGSEYCEFSLIEDNEDEYEILTIHFNLETLPYCCGVSEIGDLQINNLVHGRLDKRETTLAKYLVRYAFLKAKGYNLRGTKTNKIGYPLIFCSNGQGPCEIVEEAMKSWNQFKHVSTSRNGVGGNIIKVYITT